MSRTRRIVPFVLLLVLLTWAFGAYAQEAAPAAPQMISRWQSNLSAGAVVGKRIGIVKSFWWYAVPKLFAVGLSFDFVMPAIPLSFNAALLAPIPLVTPFVCAGAGGTLTHGGITNYGGGVRVRLGPKFGLVFEYRHYRYTLESQLDPDYHEKVLSDYFGAGISWRY
jgi:hypothetical protein